MTRATLKAWLAALLIVGLPATAPATFHLVKITDVFAGTESDPSAQYVVLEMYAPAQTFVTGHPLTVFDADGATLGTFTFPHNVAHGSTLDAILIATPEAETLFGVTADLTMTPVLQPSGGAVCWDVIDCVAWGTFSAPNALPVPPGTPFNAPTGLLLGSAMHRDLHSGGSVTPFEFASPAPQNNARQTGTLGETATPAPTATPTPTVGPAACHGDCNGDGQVTVGDLLAMVNIALGNAPISACTAGDADQNGELTVNEILSAVNNALNGCSA